MCFWLLKLITPTRVDAAQERLKNMFQIVYLLFYLSVCQCVSVYFSCSLANNNLFIKVFSKSPEDRTDGNEAGGGGGQISIWRVWQKL